MLYLKTDEYFASFYIIAAVRMLFPMSYESFFSKILARNLGEVEDYVAERIANFDKMFKTKL